MNSNPCVCRLSNGLTVILDPWDSAQVSVRISFRVGADNETESESGITHFIEHMLCDGGERFRGIGYLRSLGGEFNACTEATVIQLYGTTLPENLSTVLDVYADCLSAPRIESNVLETERGAILDEIRVCQNDLGMLFKSAMDVCLNNGKPFLPVIGITDNVQRFKRRDLLNFYHDNFTARNCVIAISGHFKKNLLNEIEQKFAFLPDKDPVAPVQTGAGYKPGLVIRGPYNPKNSMFAVMGPLDRNIDLPQNILYATCMNAFVSYWNMNLGQDLRSRVYLEPDTSVITNGNIGMVKTIVQCAPEQIYQVAAQVAKTTHDVTHGNNKINKQFLNQHINQMKYIWSSNSMDVDARCEMLTDSYLDCGDINHSKNLVEQTEKITVNDVREQTKNLFRGEDLSFAIGVSPQVFNVEHLKHVWDENFGQKNKILLSANKKNDKLH